MTHLCQKTSKKVCASFHRRTKLTRNHMIITMADAESGKHTSEVRSRSKVFCRVHPTEGTSEIFFKFLIFFDFFLTGKSESRAFCDTCDVSFCHYCHGHSKHKQIGINDAIFEKRTGNCLTPSQTLDICPTKRWFFQCHLTQINDKSLAAHVRLCKTVVM